MFARNMFWNFFFFLQAAPFEIIKKTLISAFVENSVTSLKLHFFRILARTLCLASLSEKVYMVVFEGAHNIYFSKW